MNCWVITLKYTARCCTCWKPIEAGRKAIFRPDAAKHQRFQHVKCSKAGKVALGIGPSGPNDPGQASTGVGNSNWKTTGNKLWREDEAKPSEPKRLDPEP